MSHMNTSHVRYEYVYSCQIWMSHMNTHIEIRPVMSHMNMSHVPYEYQSRHTWTIQKKFYSKRCKSHTYIYIYIYIYICI